MKQHAASARVRGEKKVKRSALFLGFLVACTLASGQVPGAPKVSRIEDGEMPGSLPGVHRATDGSMACGDLQREAQSLERMIQSHQQTMADALDIAGATATEIDKLSAVPSSYAGTGLQAATSFLPMIPGVGPLGGLAVGLASDAASAVSSGQSSSTSAAQSSMQKAMDAQQALYFEEARHQHVVALFLDKRCPLR
ncbi:MULTISPECIES: hypothetical protein [Variovorax]|uniref:hypothetical protein n=1 Tax=Variovorax TaxID=34072 RepID=UPI00285BB69C|nr:hypothetical protein [Variovorax sp. 3319]MDR6890675.1 hypothetical protein [Variovorax sp. 3319]